MTSVPATDDRGFLHDTAAVEAFTRISAEWGVMSDQEPPTPDGEPALTVYRLQACPFCERVIRVLDDLDLPYRSRFVEPLHSERDAVKRLVGARTVPAIVDENTGVTMAESANIVSYLEATYGEGGSA